MKKIVDMMLVAAMLLYSIPGLAENAFPQGNLPAQNESGSPPEFPDGMPDGQQPPEMPCL